MGLPWIPARQWTLGIISRKTKTLILVLVASLFLAVGLVPVHAATQYALSLNPGRTQEQSSPGVTVTLTVTGASSGQPYSFLLLVTDPSGAKSNATRSTIAPGSAFSFQLNYPSDFSRGSIKYVGQYNVNVAQTTPSVSASVASGHLDVGLTDKSTYERTYPVSIKADAYSSNETVRIDITHASLSAPDFPAFVNADPSGNVFFSWLTTPDLPIGNYNVTITGGSTVKAVRDSQSFLLDLTGVTIRGINVAQSSLMRSQTARFSFSADYLGGGPVQSGFATLLVTQPDFTIQQVPATYNATSARFEAGYRIPLVSMNGSWTALVKANSLQDSYGNSGPDSSPSADFIVTPASLGVDLNFTRGDIVIGNVVAIYSNITTPDGSSFAAGTVSAFVSPPGRPIGNQVNLLYDSSQRKWVGSYTVSTNDPSGVWLVKVSASDPYGNSGSGSTSSIVTVVAPVSQGSTLTLWFLTAFGAIAAGLLVGLFLLRRKRTFQHHLQVDLQAVSEEASKVKNQEFFQSIKEQIEKQREGKGS